MRLKLELLSEQLTVDELAPFLELAPHPHRPFLSPAGWTSLHEHLQQEDQHAHLYNSPEEFERDLVIVFGRFDADPPSSVRCRMAAALLNLFKTLCQQGSFETGAPKLAGLLKEYKQLSEQYQAEQAACSMAAASGAPASAQRRAPAPSRDAAAMASSPLHMRYMFSFLTAHDHQGWFVEPVDPQLFHYAALIQQPMDLRTAKEKLERGAYTCVEDCAVDIDLVFTNAIRYHGFTSAVGKEALHLQRLFLWQYTKTLQRIKQELAEANGGAAASAAAANVFGLRDEDTQYVDVQRSNGHDDVPEHPGVPGKGTKAKSRKSKGFVESSPGGPRSSASRQARKAWGKPSRSRIAKRRGAKSTGESSSSSSASKQPMATDDGNPASAAQSAPSLERELNASWLRTLGRFTQSLSAPMDGLVGLAFHQLDFSPAHSGVLMGLQELRQRLEKSNYTREDDIQHDVDTTFGRFSNDASPIRRQMGAALLRLFKEHRAQEADASIDQPSQGVQMAEEAVSALADEFVALQQEANAPADSGADPSGSSPAAAAAHLSQDSAATVFVATSPVAAAAAASHDANRSVKAAAPSLPSRPQAPAPTVAQLDQRLLAGLLGPPSTPPVRPSDLYATAAAPRSSLSVARAQTRTLPSRGTAKSGGAVPAANIAPIVRGNLPTFATVGGGGAAAAAPMKTAAAAGAPPLPRGATSLDSVAMDEEEDLDEGKEAPAVSVGRPVPAANIDHASPRVGVPTATAARASDGDEDVFNDHLLSKHIRLMLELSVEEVSRLRQREKQNAALVTALKRQLADAQAKITRLEAAQREAHDVQADSSAAGLQDDKAVAAGQKRNATHERNEEHKRRRTQQKQQQLDGPPAQINAQQLSALLVNPTPAPAAAAAEAALCESCHIAHLPLSISSSCGHRLCFMCASQIPMAAGSPCPVCQHFGTRQS
jgi:hypothetical protein